MKKILLILNSPNSYHLAIMDWWEIQNISLLITWQKFLYKLGSSNKHSMNGRVILTFEVSWNHSILCCTFFPDFKMTNLF